METEEPTGEATAEPDEPPNATTSSIGDSAGSTSSGTHAASATIANVCCTGPSQRVALRLMAFSDFVIPVGPFLDIDVTVPFLVVLPPQGESLAREAGQGVAGAAVLDAAEPASSFGVPPERFLTWHEMRRTLALCGVKRHHCQDALRKLWAYLLLLCYGAAAGRGACGRWQAPPLPDPGAGANGGVVGDFAALVRYDALHGVLRSLRRRGGGVDRRHTVDFAEFASAAAASASRETLAGTAQAAAPAAGRYTLVVAKHTFDRCIAGLLSRELRGQRLTVTPLPRWTVAQAIVQDRRPLVVFCGGTSGCGKSTLSSLITTNVCFHTLLSTDTVRQSLRRTLRREEYPELFVSTYEAHRAKEGGGGPAAAATGAGTSETETVDPHPVIAAYEKQCEVVLRALDAVLEKFIRRGQAVVVEGVHLLAAYMHRKSAELRARGVLCVPFLVCIAKEQRHVERFCTRAKCMALSPERNKYVSQFRHIRLIQQHLLDQAHALQIRVINNTNLDRSLMEVHTHLLDCIDHGVATAWDRKRTVAVGGSDAAGAADACAGAAPAEAAAAAAEPCGGGDRRHYPFADPSISGKRMLALLLKWRSEKQKRRANDAAASGGFPLATSILASTKRAQSAELLTPFRLRLLCNYSCLGDARGGSPTRACGGDVTSPGACGPATGAGAARRPRHGSPPMPLRLPFPLPQRGFFLRRPEQGTAAHAEPRRGLPLRTLAAAEESPSFAAAGQRRKAFRSASADAAGEAVDDVRARPRGNKQRGSLPRWWNTPAGNEAAAEEEEEEERGEGSCCELPSLMGS
ncbi:uncharacterized protein Tco025E_03803 [Trypanosoma conorhini]|uniref:Zeta toxin domain-containing protein n=1 Tax=Trypanosoma conorhini TaxID=83891 RepID=A0A3R7PAJ5_9TRYP|nr:uncharacterized protein Tco025E_03803 [Trypanosoma conorhini]RNF20347.1 hypothetical protein Tco025E_03803 [Trypanosoma conorhini]